MRAVLSVSLVLWISSGLAIAQSLDANRLALHNGGEYYVVGFDHDTPNTGVAKYYPSFTHWSANGVGSPTAWPWQIRGWTWAGVQANLHGPTWCWISALFYSKDYAWSTCMTWPYPVEYCLGLEPHGGPPWPVYGISALPQILPSTIAGKSMILPSSYGGFDQYMNLFAFGKGTWIIPSTVPYYGWEFAMTTTPADAITLPSVQSVYHFIWEWLGPYGQYVLLSADEMDCTLKNGGLKGKAYALGQADGFFYYFDNPCTGARHAWDMALLVNDAVTIPVNVPGSKGNPFSSYGFDAGVACVTPLVSSGQCTLKVMYEDVFGAGKPRVLLAASPWSGPALPYGPAGNRLPHAWDPVTEIFAALYPVWQATPLPGYPASSFGTTVGAHSIGLSILPDPALLCLELKYSGWSLGGRAPTASFQVCMF